ncbi:MFS transporter [Nocardioides sp. CPCC 205120]|uniref:MFS transporter n=1 Tax=Nocardioides sp. CPCC 205120 TaxID=3406462 RepID=UPI003B5126F9
MDPERDTVTESPASQPRAGLGRALAPFGIPAYRRLALALVFSTFASGTWAVALVWEVIRLGGGPGALSLVSGASAAGILLPALLGGVVADRVPQKDVLVVVALVELVGIGVVAVLAATDVAALWHLAVAAFATGMGMAFYYPAYSAWLPALVPEQHLMAVNGFEGVVRPLVQQAGGPAVAGLVIGAAAPSAAFGVGAASVAVGLLVLLTVPRTAVRRLLAPEGVDGPEGSVEEPVEERLLGQALGDVREGFAYMVRTPWLLGTLVFASLMTLLVMGPLEVLVPFLVKDGLGGDAGDHAAVLAAFGIGGALGSMTMAAFPMPRRYLTTMNVVWGVACVPFVGMALATAVWQLVACGFVLGALFGAPMVIWGTLLQRRVPPHLLGRVSSLDFFVSLALMPVSMALAGPLATLVGLTTVFVAAGLLPVGLSVAAVVLFRMRADEVAHPLRD